MKKIEPVWFPQLRVSASTAVKEALCRLRRHRRWKSFIMPREEKSLCRLKTYWRRNGNIPVSLFGSFYLAESFLLRRATRATRATSAFVLRPVPQQQIANGGALRLRIRRKSRPRNENNALFEGLFSLIFNASVRCYYSAAQELQWLTLSEPSPFIFCKC